MTTTVTSIKTTTATTKISTNTSSSTTTSTTTTSTTTSSSTTTSTATTPTTTTAPGNSIEQYCNLEFEDYIPAHNLSIKSFEGNFMFILSYRLHLVSLDIQWLMFIKMWKRYKKKV